MNSSLRELSDIEYGASPKEIRADDKTSVGIYGTGGFLGYATKSLFNGPLVVVARKGTLDNPIYVDGDCWVIDTAFAVLPKPDVEAKWLYYQLLNYDLKKLNESTGVPSINREYLYRLSFENPGSAQQRKIARILSATDAVIRQTEETIEKLKKIKQGMMHDLFTRGIDVKTGKLRPSQSEAPKLYKKTELGWISKEWGDGVFNDFCGGLINGGTPSTAIKEYWSGHIPWITGADFLDNFQIGVIRRRITQEAVSKSSTHVVPKGEILLVTRTGVGKMALAPFDIAISQDITGMIVNKKSFDAIFLYYYLQILVEEFKKLSQGTSINGIIRDDLVNWPVAFPLEKGEQELIASNLVSVDKKIDVENALLLKYRLTKQGLMQDLLTGEVEVVPDPQDKEYQGVN